MSESTQNIFVNKKEKITCSKCKKQIPKGEFFVSEEERFLGLCFACSPFKTYSFLPSGDAAMTRRSKKHSVLCGAVLEWNQRRKRFERKGQYVELKAIALAEQECQADVKKRAISNQKAAIKRAEQDKIYIKAFAVEIRKAYPFCPENRETEIATHACEKYSGRVGRTADAKQFDEQMIDLAVEAHIRHTETKYDDLFGKGKIKKEIRQDVKSAVLHVMDKWRNG